MTINSVTGSQLLDLLGDWAAGRGPLYRRIVNGLLQVIDRGLLPGGVRLPSERSLAKALAVSRTTVVAAYEMLKGGGYLEARQGSGTWVATAAGQRPVLEGNEGIRDFLGQDLMTRRITSDGAFIDFSIAAPTGVAVAEILTDAYRSVADQELNGLLRGGGYAPAGLGDLRQAIADLMTQMAVPSTADQILVTNGAQQAIWLAASLYVEGGAGVIIESPTYPGALDVFRAHGARLLPLAVGHNGLSVADFEQLVSHRAARLAYLIPTFHNPTGTVLGGLERSRVVQLATRFRIPVIEDITNDFLALDSDPPPPLASYSDDTPILTVGSMSKFVWPGLRVGWVRAPESTIIRLLRRKNTVDLGSSVLNQLVAARLLTQADEISTIRRRDTTARLAQVTSLLEELLPSWNWQQPQGGLSLWIRLPEGNAEQLAQVALRHGVGIVPGSNFDPEAGHTEHLRLALSLDEDATDIGIRRLANAWNHYHRQYETEAEPVQLIV